MHDAVAVMACPVLGRQVAVSLDGGLAYRAGLGA